MTAQQIPADRFEWERLVRRVVVDKDTFPERAKYLALMLATYADPDGTRVRPSLPTLVAVLGHSESTVKRHLAVLRRHGLLEVTRRGGGRGGKGKTTEYRLTVPTDLLDRLELLGVDDNPRTESEATQATSESTESQVTQVTSQTAPATVDNSESETTHMTPENDFHSSHDAVTEPLGGQNDEMGAHPGDLLPRHLTIHSRDQDSSHLPTQPPTARANPSSTTDPADHSSDHAPRPAKCHHGLPAHTRHDGTPACPLCRRSLPALVPARPQPANAPTGDRSPPDTPSDPHSAIQAAS